MPCAIRICHTAKAIFLATPLPQKMIYGRSWGFTEEEKGANPSKALSLICLLGLTPFYDVLAEAVSAKLLFIFVQECSINIGKT